jgi:ABC-type lipoprotein export system ATPase subunit
MDSEASRQAAAVSVRSISQTFTVGDEIIRPLHTVSFDIAKNSFTIIYGPSGSGKSTLLNVLTGLLKPSSGSVTFFGEDVYGLTPDELAYFRANQIGIVYQTNFWVNSLNVLENIAMPLYFLGYSRSKAAKKAQDALERIGMGEYRKKCPVLLSGGEQQRVAMARAIVADPQFVVADEPTGALDSTNGDKIISLLETCQEEYGQTVILVTHNMEYLPLADNLLHIQDGQVQQMRSSTIRETANQLLADMKRRIDTLADSRQQRGRRVS